MLIIATVKNTENSIYQTILSPTIIYKAGKYMRIFQIANRSKGKQSDLQEPQVPSSNKSSKKK